MTLNLPRLLVGSSPFIGAGQFGWKAYEYYAYFYLNPGNIVALLEECAKIGFEGLQLLPFKPLIEAVKEVKRRGFSFTIVGSVGVGNLNDDIKALEDVNSKAAVLHASLTDQARIDVVKRLLKEVKERGMLAGLATHKPYTTLKRLLSKAFPFDYDFVMLTLNSKGIFMDAPPQNVIPLIERLGKPVIAKKVLGAGVIRPLEAFNFIAKVKFVESVAVGVTSKAEALEVLEAAAKAFNGLNKNGR